MAILLWGYTLNINGHTSTLLQAHLGYIDVLSKDLMDMGAN